MMPVFVCNTREKRKKKSGILTKRTSKFADRHDGIVFIMKLKS